LAGFDEMDEVSGDGSAELFDDGTIEVEFAYHMAMRPSSKPVAWRSAERFVDG
jgi:hypothetical protein